MSRGTPVEAHPRPIRIALFQAILSERDNLCSSFGTLASNGACGFGSQFFCCIYVYVHVYHSICHINVDVRSRLSGIELASRRRRRHRRRHRPALAQRYTSASIHRRCTRTLLIMSAARLGTRAWRRGARFRWLADPSRVCSVVV